MAELCCPWPESAPSPEAFVALVRREGRRLYRDLPWRYIDDAYAVLVSEVMLQQTQVKRVLGRWERFLAKFPTPDALASASTSDVVGEWQGLGYNRRALALKRACEICSRDFGGKLPEAACDLERLPGIGPATAAGVVAFAFNRPALYLETNVRTVFLHELFPDEGGVRDKQLEPLVRATCPAENPREWYYALLDYGAHLKATLGNASRRSAHYTRQSAFEGSRRQKRAEVVRIVLAAERAIPLPEVHSLLDTFERKHGRDGVDDVLFSSIVADLQREGFFTVENDRARA
ncbi:adenine glycosylase [uncultured Ellagibacter sp.]|uniref:adenine glycosylase n=1 Tax=uncultured Ellagibacter sp. TaxID=2137580 RepID=UPI00263507E5|nr:adenine glycosylase [uncultured Ellagibacter sp.]